VAVGEILPGFVGVEGRGKYLRECLVLGGYGGFWGNFKKLSRKSVTIWGDKYPIIIEADE